MVCWVLPITRCPVGAISRAGHDKERCGGYVYGPQIEELAKRYGVAITGCGLCQTKVPCERRFRSQEQLRRLYDVGSVVWYSGGRAAGVLAG